MSTGLRDSEAGVTERYGPDAVGRKVWELCMSRPMAREAFQFFSKLRELGSQSNATVIIAIKHPVGIILSESSLHLTKLVKLREETSPKARH